MLLSHITERRLLKTTKKTHQHQHHYGYFRKCAHHLTILLMKCRTVFISWQRMHLIVAQVCPIKYQHKKITSILCACIAHVICVSRSIRPTSLHSEMGIRQSKIISLNEKRFVIHKHYTIDAMHKKIVGYFCSFQRMK